MTHSPVHVHARTVIVFYPCMSAMPYAMQAPPTQPPLLVLGILCNERRRNWASRLRKLYAPFVDSGRVVVRYVYDEKWLARKSWQKLPDEIGVPTGRGLNMHCAHKMVGWWRGAHRWSGTFYAKTDDDATLDLARLLPLIERLPRHRLYSGILRYSSINETSLEGVCWSAGAHGAVKKHMKHCPTSRGPIVFAEGPFILMSQDVQRWVAPKLHIDSRQRCHFEDLLLGRELMAIPALNIANLGPLIAEPNVVSSPTRHHRKGMWLGTKGPLAHWTRTEALYGRTLASFARAEQQVPIRTHPSFNCSLWRREFMLLRDFPCCQDWSLCAPADAGEHWATLRRTYLGGVPRLGVPLP